MNTEIARLDRIAQMIADIPERDDVQSQSSRMIFTDPVRQRVVRAVSVRWRREDRTFEACYRSDGVVVTLHHVAGGGKLIEQSPHDLIAAVRAGVDWACGPGRAEP